MEKNIKFIIGLILFIYGIIKISIGIIGSLLPENIQSKFNDYYIFKHFINNDNTFAGNLFLYCLMFYGMYSVLHSLHILNILSDDFKKYVNKHAFLIVNFIIGIILTIYYYLILYTNTNIESDNAYRKTYITHGLFTGIFFLLMIPLSNVYYKIKEFGLTNVFLKFPVYMMASTIVIIGLLYEMTILLIEADDIKNIDSHDIMMMIPFNSMV